MYIQNRIKILKKNRKAVSPVISTIIIVAIAIAISIAVALYLTGITGTFTRFERLDITSSYVNPTNGLAELTVKNSGTSTLTIDRILLNGKPQYPPADNAATVAWIASCGTSCISGTTNSNSSTPGIALNGSGDAAAGKAITIVQGDTGTIKIAVTGTSGQSVEITIHTASGKEYPKVAVLP